VGRSCGCDYLPTGLRELGIAPASIIGGRAPGDVPERLEAINEACARASTEDRGVGELCHSHSLAGRVAQQEQHLGMRQRQAVRSLHLDVQLVDDECVDLQKPPPRCEFLLGELIGGGRW
jgi:hypothetical protein